MLSICWLSRAAHADPLESINGNDTANKQKQCNSQRFGLVEINRLVALCESVCVRQRSFIFCDKTSLLRVAACQAAVVMQREISQQQLCRKLKHKSLKDFIKALNVYISVFIGCEINTQSILRRNTLNARQTTNKAEI